MINSHTRSVKLIYQTNRALGAYINKWGCFLMAIIQKVEKNGNGLTFNERDILGIYENAKRHGFVSQEKANKDGTAKDGCYVLEPQMLYNMVSEMFGFRTRCLSYKKEDSDYTPDTTIGEEEILELKRDGMSGSHFVSGNGKKSKTVIGRIEFDPIESGSITARLGWIDSIRIFQTRSI